MREIKFRGKATAGDKWTFGHLMFWAGNYQIWETEKNGETHNYQVIPETVGQFTGLHDKNGNEIYEGDAVRIVFNQNANSYSGSNVNLTEHICIVEYNAAMAGFCLRNTTDKTPNKHNFKVISFNHYRLRDVKEIIGNIHENPQLN